MHLDRWTLLLQTVNFAVLIWLLHRFLYRPVQRLSEARQAEIQRQFSEAHALAEQAQSRLSALDAQRAGIAAEREAALKAAGSEAEAAAAALQTQARHEAQTILEQTRATLVSEREQAARDLQALAFDLGGHVALLLLRDLPASVRDEAFLERMVRYLAALPAEQLQGLRAQLATGAALQVLCAEPLGSVEQQRWTEQLQHVLDSTTPVSFTVDGSLELGAELRFPQARLEFSWHSVLDDLRQRWQSSAPGPTPTGGHAHAI